MQKKKGLELAVICHACKSACLVHIETQHNTSGCEWCGMCVCVCACVCVCVCVCVRACAPPHLGNIFSNRLSCTSVTCMMRCSSMDRSVTSFCSIRITYRACEAETCYRLISCRLILQCTIEQALKGQAVLSVHEDSHLATHLTVRHSVMNS